MGDKDKPCFVKSWPIIIPNPKIPIIEPITSFLVIFSFKKIAAKRRVKIGSDETIIPAFIAVVKVNPKKKKEILKVIPEKPHNVKRGMSALCIFSFL